MPNYPLPLFLLLSVGWSNPSVSNDGYAEMGLGRLVPGKTYDTRMVSEVLEVSPRKILVDYVFEGKTGTAVPVLFPLPLYSADTPSHSWAGAPQGFSTTVNGVATKFQTIVKGRKNDCTDSAFARNRSCITDVTATLKAVGLSDAQIALYPSASPFSYGKGAPHPTPLSSKQASLLLQGRLVDKEGPSSESYYPNWLADVTYAWSMPFKDSGRVVVSHEYVPFTSGGSNSYYFTENILRNDYCADDQLIAAWQKLVKASGTDANGYGPVLGSRVEYILTTANSWGGPIQEFTLRLKKEKASELVMLCFPGKVRKIGPLTLEIKLFDFEPKHELRVLFLNLDPDRDVPMQGVAPLISLQ